MWLMAGARLALVSTLAAFQMPWRVYPSLEGYDNVPVPPDYQEKTEWIFARLMYPRAPVRAVQPARLRVPRR